MQIKNTATRYGFVTKLFHWTIFLLFVNQYVVGEIMTSIQQGELALGFTQGNLFNWHKSIGLIILVVALFRYTWRRTTRLPDWAPTLSGWERTTIHWIERTLYACMLIMPLSGYLFVMAGGFGVMFFGAFPLPNIPAQHETLAWMAEAAHKITAYVIVVVLTMHIGLGVRHQLVNKDRFLNRMLPFTHQ